MSNNKFNIPTIIIIFGVTGDLSQRKLIPALLDLKTKNALPTAFRILGFSRREMTDDEFRKFMKTAINRKKHQHSKKDADFLLNKSFYQSGTFEDIKSYKNLTKTLKKLDDDIGQCTNKLFYLAVPPTFYEPIFKNLAKSGLTKPCSNKTGWTRVLVEKPFGKDIKTAQKLDKLLAKLFQEEQIFRIDHYLAKETMQNILTFRFANSIFEPIWNNKFIEKVEIKLLEKLDVANRGSFYDGVGALRDVGQNHILQMLAFIAMNNPGEIKADLIRKERTKIMKALCCVTPTAIKNNTIRGQYIDYQETKGIKPNSKTETYFKIKAFVNNQRWQGVPFYLESGKALNKNTVEINIYFKQSTNRCFCPPSHQKHKHQNVISFKIQPQEEINIRFWSKQPGLTTEIEPKDLSFDYSKGTTMKLDAYEKVLFNCIVGDQTSFASNQEIEAAWKFITAILNGWKKNKLYQYKKGSEGPKINL